MPERFRATFDDGVTMLAKLWLPREPRATVVVLPALGMRAGYYDAVGDELERRGFAAVSADHRGHGESSVRPSREVDFGYARLVADTITVAREARARTGAPTFALGHSLGGHVAAMAAGRMPGTFDGITMIASGTPWAARYPLKTRAQILLLARLIRPMTAALGYYPGERIGFAGREARRLMLEWSVLARRGVFDIAGGDAEGWMRASEVPALALSLDGDAMGPPAAVDHLVSKLGGPTTRAHLTSADCEPAALDHLRWAKAPRVAVERVAAWVTSRLEGR